jgi:coenzyme F420-reducing hydrogenase alpha subunit
MKDILDKYICRIEGHGYLKLNYDHAKVQLVIDEGERLFEKLLIGRPYSDAPFITARICGVCPTAHTLASINALENAFGVEINKDIEGLRKVLLAGQIIQSHALHFFFLAAPDYIGLDNALELADKKPEVFKVALALKEIGDDIVRTIGGRQVHPVTPQVGGFTKKFDKKDLLDLKKRIEGNMHFALETLDLAGKFKYPNFKNKTQNFALTNWEKYAFLNGKITSNTGLKTDIQNYELSIKEKVMEYSSAKHATHNKESFMVGALSRINLQTEKLNPKAKAAAKKVKRITIPSYNPFHINFAQAVEIVHFMEESVQCLDSLINGRALILKSPYKVKASSAAGAIEAPRGTLYHYYEIDSKGIIVDCDIITPTVQNLEDLEKNAEYILENTKDLPEEERYHLLEMLVRAYDPCITCSVH